MKHLIISSTIALLLFSCESSNEKVGSDVENDFEANKHLQQINEAESNFNEWKNSPVESTANKEVDASRQNDSPRSIDEIAKDVINSQPDDPFKNAGYGKAQDYSGN